MTSRIRVLALLVVVAVVGLGAVVVARGSWFEEPVPAPRSPRLPDLVSLPLADFLVGTDEEGNEALRFSSTIANVGNGPLCRLSGANLVFGGHGHEHWHLKFGASYRLLSEAGRQLASQTKPATA